MNTNERNIREYKEIIITILFQITNKKETGNFRGYWIFEYWMPHNFEYLD